MRVALRVRARLEVAEVGAEGELHVHVEHVALGHQERVVRQGAGALDRGLLLVVDVLEEAGEPEDVLRHPLPPLASRLRVGQHLAQALGAGRERLGDLGLGAQRFVDLAELLGAALPELANQVAEAVHLRPQLVLHLVEPGVDDVLLRRQLALSGRELGAELLPLEEPGLLQELPMVGGDLVELLALDHGRLLERGVDGGVPLGHGLLAGGGARAGRGRPADVHGHEGTDHRHGGDGGQRDEQDDHGHRAMFAAGWYRERGCLVGDRVRRAR